MIGSSIAAHEISDCILQDLTRSLFTSTQDMADKNQTAKMSFSMTTNVGTYRQVAVSSAEPKLGE